MSPSHALRVQGHKLRTTEPERCTDSTLAPHIRPSIWHSLLDEGVHHESCRLSDSAWLLHRNSAGTVEPHQVRLLLLLPQGGALLPDSRPQQRLRALCGFNLRRQPGLPGGLPLRSRLPQRVRLQSKVFWHSRSIMPRSQYVCTKLLPVTARHCMVSVSSGESGAKVCSAFKASLRKCCR